MKRFTPLPFFAIHPITSLAKNLGFIALFLLTALSSKAQVDITSTGGTPTASYSTLKAAFSNINSGVHTGAIEINLTGNTIETDSAVLDSSGFGGVSNYTSILIKPSGGGAREITGSIAGSLIRLNGADNVTINGLNTGGNSLIISNTATGNVNTIRFVNDASQNSILNCQIKGASSNVTTGTILFALGIVTGNDNNTIAYCNLDSTLTGKPTNAIYSLGSVTAGIENSGNTINRSNIGNYFSATLATSGITLAAGNTAWQISNNKLFQSATRTYTTTNAHRGIAITSGNGYMVSDNTIGFADTNGTGTYTMNGGVTSTFVGILLTVGSTSTSTIQNNIISRISFTSTSTTATVNGAFAAISATTGNVNITGNTIGSTSALASISISVGSAGALMGINSSSTNTVLIQNNTFGGLQNIGAAAATAATIQCINVSGVTTLLTVRDNTIGNSLTNNIVAGTLGVTTAATLVNGLIFASVPTTFNFIHNTIQNLSSFGSSASAYVRGITTSTTASAGSLLFIDSNTIHHLTANGLLADLSSGLSEVAGIHFFPGTNGIISNNTIYDLSALNTGTASTYVVGIAHGNAFNTTITNNKIYNLSNAGTSAAATTPAIIAGIAIRSGNTNLKINNNFISLGIGQSSNTAISGIQLNHGSTPDPTLESIKFNTIYIGGTVTTGAQPSFGIARTDFSATARTAAVDIKGNILLNNRTGGTGKHYAINNNYGATASATGWTSNNNIFYSANLDTVASWGNTNHKIATWRTTSAGDAGSFSKTISLVNPTTCDLHLAGASQSDVDLAIAFDASVATDFDNQLRTVTTTQMGGDEFVLPCIAPPTAGTAVSAVASICASTPFTVTLSGASVGGGLTYQWQVSSTGAAGTFVNIPLATSYQLNTTQTATNSYRAVLTCSGQSDTTNAVQIVTITTPLAGTYTVDTSSAASATNYHSINSFVSDLGCRGITAAVVLNVVTTNTTYFEQVNFATITGISSTNTVTINGNGNTISSANSPVVSFANANNIIWDNLNVLNTGATGFGIQINNGSHHITIKNSTINVGTTATATTNAGIVVAATTALTVGNNGKYLTIENNEIIGGYYGITLIGNTGYADNYGSIIRNNTVRDFYTYGIYTLHADSTIISHNNINRALRTTVSTLYGIAINQSRYIKVNGNEIHSTGANAYTAYPIYITNSISSTGFETEITNNKIHNIDHVSGIFYGIYGLTTNINGFKIYHNSIDYVTPSASTEAIRGLFIAVVPTNVDFKNNAISITGSGTGVKTGIYITTIASATFTSNHNVIYVNTTASNNIGYWGAVKATLADWQTASSQDANSLVVNPQYTNNPFGNLEPLNPALDNTGTPVGVLIDFNDNARDLTTPDIGAYEFSILVCTSPPTAGNTASDKDSTLCKAEAVVLSLDSTSSTGIGQTYQWEIATDSVGPYASIPNDTNTFTTVYQSAPHWYRVALTCSGQTSYTIPTFIYTDSNSVPQALTIDTTLAASDSNYHSLSALINVMNCRGLSGPTTITFAPHNRTYVGNINFSEIFGISETNTLTIYGNGNTIQSATSPVVSFNNARYIIWDSLNVLNTGATGFGIQINNASQHITIKNSTINVGTTATVTTNVGIVVAATTALSVGNNGQYLTIENNEIIGGYYGITLIGNTGYANNYHNIIRNNTVRDFYTYGIYTLHADSTIISHNNINRALRTTVSTLYGIAINQSRYVKIDGNEIHSTGAAAYSAYPIYITNSISSAGFETEITNNKIYNINQISGIFYGIYGLTTNFSGFKIYHNSIDYVTPSASTEAIRGLFIGIVPTNVDFKNNVISITGSGTGVKTGIYISTIASATFTSNNNVIYVNTTAASNNIGYWGAVKTTLADWQTASLQDANSLIVNPQFTNNPLGNLEPLNPALDDTGVPVGVLTDFNGNPRSVTTPDIGAYEFHIPVCMSPPLAGNTLSDKDSTLCKTEAIQLSIDSTTSTGVGQTYQWEMATDSVGPYANIPNGTNNAVTIYQSSSNWYRVAVTCSGLTSYTIPTFVYTDSVSMPQSLTVDTNLAVSPTNYHSLAALVNVMNCRGVSGHTTITLAPHINYTENITFDSIAGLSETNTLTIYGNGNTIQSSTSPVVSFVNARYIIWDSLNVTNTGATGFGIQINKGSHHVTIKKSIINVGTTATATTNACIVVANTTALTLGKNGQYITIENNEIIGGYYGITLIGDTGYNHNYGSIIQHNTIRDFYIYGIYTLHADTTVISHNNINRALRADVSTLYGISLNQSRYVKVHNNQIHSTGAESYTAYPIYFTNSVNSTGFETEIINNKIFNINQTAGIFTGIYGLTTNITGFKIYHNTIDYNVPTASTSAIRGMQIAVAPNNVEFKNNIINIVGGGTGVKTGIYITTTSTTFVSNHNDIYVNTTASNNVGFWAAVNATLANWQTASSQDLNSSDANPVFISTTDLTPLSNIIDNIGTPVGVLTDFSGVTRDLTTPDIGAIEFMGLAGDVRIVSARLSRFSQCYSTQDTAWVTFRNLLGATIDFSIDPLTIEWNITGPVNSNGSIVVNTGTLTVGSSLSVYTNTIDQSLPGIYSLRANLQPNTVNVLAANDTLETPFTLEVKAILSVTPKTVTVNSNAETATLIAKSPLFPAGAAFFSEICHWRGATGAAPAGGWPSYVIADDYVEITGTPNANIDGYTMEVWVSAAIQHTAIFATGTNFSPVGTMVIGTGQLGASVPSPANFYYHSGNTTTYGSTDIKGYILKDQNGVIVDAVAFGAYTFPVASGVTASDWSGSLPSVSSAGIRLVGPDNNTVSSWAVESATERQDPNTLNPAVTAPIGGSAPGFNWNHLGASISVEPKIIVGPYNVPGVYTYIAEFTSACGTFYDTAYVTASAAVPVKLVSFTAEPKANDAILNWTTASEINNSHFIVQLSIDGSTFKSIGTVKGNGTSTTSLHYTFTDKDAASVRQTIYYRLISMDKDGSSETSKTAIVNFKTQALSKLEQAIVSPNPFTDKIQLSISSDVPEMATIKLIDIQGKVMLNRQYNLSEGLNNINFDMLENIEKGIFFLQVILNNETRVIKILKN